MIQVTMMRILFFLVYSFLSLSQSKSIDEIVCSCENVSCPPSQSCSFGKTRDICNCCYICAKGPNEECGGIYNYAGTCANGLKCKPHESLKQLPGKCVDK
ncbi:single insulin-like growth factor-binding domain protein-2 [Centruroides sculpturatus]|uniref:single insulin-like growth factor-binding domain protein-2 n=1 Tax=Centruroides sculpturatus TaxID=218467 RepID=UPI000C6CA855|nr:single insulin-like growth factor-binding domain protein-2 [Centruroides sculpturatus]